MMHCSGNASSIEESGNIGPKNGKKSNSGERHDSTSCSKLGAFFCVCFVREDCRSDEDSHQQQSGEEDVLFCTLCNAEVTVSVWLSPNHTPTTPSHQHHNSETPPTNERHYFFYQLLFSDCLIEKVK